MKELALVAMGAVIGACSRHLIVKMSGVLTHASFFKLSGYFRLVNVNPDMASAFGIALANGIGCFLAGVILHVGQVKAIGQSASIFIVTGILGSLTTLSSMHLISMEFIQEGRLMALLVNWAFGSIACFFILYLGYVCAQLVTGAKL